MFVFVGLGSNQGDRAANLRAGITGFARLSGAYGLWQSPVYESAPMYTTEQPAFLNMVIGGAVKVEPWEVLYRCKELEGEQGRDLSTHAQRNGPRPLDMDILLSFENDWPDAQDTIPRLVSTPELTIPHPKMAERAFVLYPLREMVPDLRHPTLGLTIAELAEGVAGQDARKLGYLEEIEESEPIAHMRWIEPRKSDPRPGDVMHEEELDSFVMQTLLKGYSAPDNLIFLYIFRDVYGKTWTLRLLDAIIAELQMPSLHIPLREKRASLATLYRSLRSDFAEQEYEGMLP